MATIEQLMKGLPAIREWLAEPTADEHTECINAIEHVKTLLGLAQRLWAVNQGLRLALNKQPDVPLSLFTVEELDTLEALMARINDEHLLDGSHEFKAAQVIDALKLALRMADESIAANTRETAAVSKTTRALTGPTDSLSIDLSERQRTILEWLTQDAIVVHHRSDQADNQPWSVENGVQPVGEIGGANVVALISLGFAIKEPFELYDVKLVITAEGRSYYEYLTRQTGALK